MKCNKLQRMLVFSCLSFLAVGYLHANWLATTHLAIISSTSLSTTSAQPGITLRFNNIAIINSTDPKKMTWPPGATGRCKDGTFTTAVHHQGACSHHKGVMSWKN